MSKRQLKFTRLLITIFTNNIIIQFVKIKKYQKTTAKWSSLSNRTACNCLCVTKPMDLDMQASRSMTGLRTKYNLIRIFLKATKRAKKVICSGLFWFNNIKDQSKTLNHSWNFHLSCCHRISMKSHAFDNFIYSDTEVTCYLCILPLFCQHCLQKPSLIWQTTQFYIWPAEIYTVLYFHPCIWTKTVLGYITKW